MERKATLHKAMRSGCDATALRQRDSKLRANASPAARLEPSLRLLQPGGGERLDELVHRRRVGHSNFDYNIQ